MLNTLGIVQIRAELLQPGWKSWRGCGGKSLVEWVVRRATESQRLDGVIVVGSSQGECDEAAHLIPPDVPFFASCRPDALSQLAEASIHFPCLNIVRICLEHPLIDPVSIDRLVTNALTYPKFDYIGYCNRQGQPAIELPLGCCAEIFKSKALRLAEREATSKQDRQSVTRYLYSHPERFQVDFLKLPEALDQAEFRFALSAHEDWDRMQDLCDALGEEPDWRDMTDYLACQPTMRRQMAELNATMNLV